jgi:hypothetical protein
LEIDMDSRFTPFILIELPQRQARRTNIILGTLFLLLCVLTSLAIASKAAASPMETGKPNTSQTKEIQTKPTPAQATQTQAPQGQARQEQARQEQAPQGQATQAQKTAAPHSTTVITQGISLVKAGKFSDAYSVLHPLADSGNAGAQYLVGIILAKGARYCQMMCWTMPISTSTQAPIMGPAMARPAAKMTDRQPWQHWRTHISSALHNRAILARRSSWLSSLSAASAPTQT